MESTPASPANNAGQMVLRRHLHDTQAILGVENNAWTELDGPAATFAQGTFYTLQVVANGTSLSLGVNGTSYVTNVLATGRSRSAFDRPPHVLVGG